MPSIVLVTGANGQLGQELQNIAAKYPQYRFHFVARRDIDLSDTAAVESFFHHTPFDALIHCAAYTQVDKAESESELAYRINGEASAAIARACARRAAPLLYVSTDYVFDGTHGSANEPSSVCNPLNVYGSSKRAGELAVLENNPCTLVVRTSWVYSVFGNNFVKSMLRLGKERPALHIVSDQISAPTYAADLAVTLLLLLEKRALYEQGNIVHFSNAGVASWYDFADEIMRQSGIPCPVNPIKSSEFPTAATRPLFSLLSLDSLRKDFGIHPTHWKDALIRCLEVLKTTNN